MTIGQYEILPIDNEYFEVRLLFSDGSYLPIKICGGDLETVLSTVFISTEKYPRRYKEVSK